MGRRFRLRALGFVVLSTALAAGCGSKREVLATDRQDDLDDALVALDEIEHCQARM